MVTFIDPTFSPVTFIDHFKISMNPIHVCPRKHALNASHQMLSVHGANRMDSVLNLVVDGVIMYVSISFFSFLNFT